MAAINPRSTHNRSHDRASLPKRFREMFSETPGSSPNPKNVYPICGIQVEFPYRPYGSQLAYMGRVISTLDRAQREGHCHALLESPTGTGKSLSLLCSTLAWQQNHKMKNQYGNLSQSKPAPEALTDPLAYGGGFIPEVQSSISESVEPSHATTNNKTQKKKITHTIYYASRTHSQISQVVREYRKTSYRVPMAVLASRKHYCTNKHIKGKENMDEECKSLLKNREGGCFEYKNAHKVKSHPSLQKGGCHEAHDIEDLVKVGQVVKGCSYYAARSMAEDAQLVFCPYNYIINPVIRGAMEVDIKGAIVILDEAHNIEDISRAAGSVDVEEDALYKLQMELGQLCAVDALVYQPLYEMTQDLLSWIERRKSSLEKHEYQHYVSSWTGDKALRELQEANISQQCFPILLECATKAVKAATDTESEITHLSGVSVITLEGLFSSLTYFFSRNGSHIYDYQLSLQRHVKKDFGKKLGGWTQTLSLWCLNPAVVFRDITELSLSVILTSGTLSPMNSFSSELGVQFGTSLEAPHVIDVESQVWPAIISTGAGNYPLNASYKTANGYAFQDAVGKSLEEIFLVVPGGCLVFFPSYKLMEKLCNRWSDTGQWSKLSSNKFLFAEPRGGSQEDLDSTLKGYYDCIRQGIAPVTGKKKRVKKVKINHSDVNDLDNSKKGAAFFAVCRGKISEGVDFSDDNARVVIIVGVPFPNINDIQVSLKKKYNDTYKSSKNLLSGGDWYCQQTFRALNQAAGRCIRHRFDFGAIILLDERFQEERNKTYISKWLRKSIKQFDNFDQSMAELKSFFNDVKERIGKSKEDITQNYDATIKTIPCTNQSKRFRKIDENCDKSEDCGPKMMSELEYGSQFTLSKSQNRFEFQLSVQATEDTNPCTNIIDLESGYEEESRCHESLPLALQHDDPDISIVKETPSMDANIRKTTAGSISRDEDSSLTLVEVSPESPDVLSYHSISVTNPRNQQSIVDTPERHLAANGPSLMPEIESSMNMSVNSYGQKKRRYPRSFLENLVQTKCDIIEAKAPGYTDITRSFLKGKSTNGRIEFGNETSSAEQSSRRSPIGDSLSSNKRILNVSSSPGLDKRLEISCSLCRSPLGLQENHLTVMCSVMMSSKIHLATLYKERLRHPSESLSTNIPVVITDISSVDQRLLNRTSEGAGQGIWCEEDGCVFNTIFCPFCSKPDNCLGVQIMATNVLNVQLLDRVMFFYENLEIKDNTTSNNKALVNRDLLSNRARCEDKIAVLNTIEKFSYSPQQSTAGWRDTRSKVRK